MLFLIFFNCRLYTGRNEEVLLFQTKLFTCIMIIIRIKNITNILCQCFLFYRFSVFTFVKFIQLEFADWLCIPDTQSIYDFIVISYDWHIIWNSQNRLVTFLNEMVSSCCRIIFYAYITAEFYFFCIFRTTQFKRISVFQPVIRYFYLISIFNFLFEQTIMITNTASICAIS